MSEQMIEKGITALSVCTCKEGRNQHGHWRRIDMDCPACGDIEHKAKAVIDAAMPAVDSVEALEALPPGTKLISSDGTVWWNDHVDARCYWCTKSIRAHNRVQVLADHGPLRVIWTPEVTA